MTSPAADVPVAYDIPGAAAAVQLSATYIRREMHAGRLRARQIDRKYQISRADLEAWFDALPEAPTHDARQEPYRS